MNNEYSQERDRVNAKAGLICCSVFFLGILIGGLFFAFYPNSVLCPYTDNSILCTKTSCNKGYWGENCLKCKQCVNGTCIGSGSNLGTGLCKCNRGWTGTLCDICDEGYWGLNCLECDMCVNGVCNGSNTNFGNGNCICNEPFTGKNCLKCMPNYYGPLCKNKCNNTNCLNGECSNKENFCKNCPVGYTGNLCDKCDIRYIKLGNKCIKNNNLTQICSLDKHGLSITDDKFGDCKECPKNKYGVICSGNGKCIGRGTVYGSGKCNCNNNYVGEFCDNKGVKVNTNLCNNSCSNKGVCIRYNNSYFCNCENNFIGELCSKCDIGYIVKNNSCEKCTENSGYWGKYCQKCSCQNGICNDGFFGNGTCNCIIGWTGPNCDVCKKNFFGKKCNKCPKCKFGMCNDGILGDGKCYCDKGYTGSLCKKCSKGFVKNNYFCQECPGSLGGKRNNCYDNGKCVIRNNKAVCICNKGFKGRTCIEYSSNNCEHLEYCSGKGICKENNCFCNQGYYSDNCNLTTISYLKSMNNTKFFVNSIDPKKIESMDNKKKVYKTGESIGASIALVFSFLGCIISIFWLVKNKKKIKMKFTQQTASVKIELTNEEKKYMNENPIFTLDDKSEKGVYFTKGLKIITEAVELDNRHDYKEAKEKYNKGIDNFMVFLKLEKNSQVRFNMAKRLDIYLKRIQILDRYLNDNTIINIPECPKPPLVKK